MSEPKSLKITSHTSLVLYVISRKYDTFSMVSLNTEILVTINFHYMGKSSLDIPLNISFYIIHNNNNINNNNKVWNGKSVCN